MANRVKVIITNKQKDVKLPSGLRMLVRRCCNAVLKTEGFPYSAEISVVFVNNEQIQELNKKHRGIDQPTDVLSFPIGENGKYDINLDTDARILGDVVISVEKAEEQAKKYGHTIQREVGFLTVHSVLHLLGYDHEENIERLRMREKEEGIMKQIGLSSTLSYGLK